MELTLETMRNRLANVAENNKYLDGVECQQFVDFLNAHLSAQAKVRFPDDVEEVTTSLGDDAAYLRMQNDGESEIADNMDRAAELIESFAARLSQGAQGEAVYAVAEDGVSESGHQLYTIHDQRVPNADNWKLFQHPAERAAVPDMKSMVDRFLAWRLPDDFRPDGGISFTHIANPAWTHDNWPTGTNLFHAGQVEVMLRHILTAAPQPPEGARVVDDWEPSDDEVRAWMERNDLDDQHLFYMRAAIDDARSMHMLAALAPDGKEG